MKQLKRTYPDSLILVQMLRTENKEEWLGLMQEDNRNSEEILEREKNFDSEIEMHHKVWDIDVPEVILNLPKIEDLNKNLLLQLKGIIKRREKRLESTLSYGEERGQ